MLALTVMDFGEEGYFLTLDYNVIETFLPILVKKNKNNNIEIIN